MVEQTEIDRIQKTRYKYKSRCRYMHIKRIKTLHKTIDATLQYSNYQIYEQCI